MSAQGELYDIIDTLGEDEIRVLLEIARRLQRGAQIYGRFDLDTDTRDFAREGHEELQDYLVYFACERLKKAGAR